MAVMWMGSVPMNAEREIVSMRSSPTSIGEKSRNAAGRVEV
jgi:hypothetical protein